MTSIELCLVWRHALYKQKASFPMQTFIVISAKMILVRECLKFIVTACLLKISKSQQCCLFSGRFPKTQKDVLCSNDYHLTVNNKVSVSRYTDWLHFNVSGRYLNLLCLCISAENDIFVWCPLK